METDLDSNANTDEGRSAEFKVTCTLPIGWDARLLADAIRHSLGVPELDWQVTEVSSPELRKERKEQHDKVMAAILEKVEGDLKDRKVTLSYADRDDSLRPEQVQVLLKGENPYESSEFSYLEDAESDQRYDAAIEEIKSILSTEEYALLDTDPEALDEARSMVYDHDDSNLITAILENTTPMLLRYDLGVDVDTDYTSSDEDLNEMMGVIVEALSLPDDHPVRGRLKELLTEGQSGRLYVIWSDWPSHVIEKAWPLQKPRMGDDVPAATITWNREPAGSTSAHLLTLDSANGTGHHVRLGAPLTVPFDADRLTTDAKSGGYGWDAVAGLVKSAFEASVDIDMLTWRSADTDDPLDQTADSVRHSGWYTIGPDHDDRWSVTYCWNENDTTQELGLGNDWRGEVVAKRQAEEHERKIDPIKIN